MKEKSALDRRSPAGRDPVGYRTVIRRRIGKKMGHSKPEETLAWQMRVGDLPLPMREYQFHSEKRWKLHFAWPAKKVAVEVLKIGTAWDNEKYNEAAILGWRVIHVYPFEILSGHALTTVIRALSSIPE